MIIFHIKIIVIIFLEVKICFLFTNLNHVFHTIFLSMSNFNSVSSGIQLNTGTQLYGEMLCPIMTSLDIKTCARLQMCISELIFEFPIGIFHLTTCLKFTRGGKTNHSGIYTL